MFDDWNVEVGELKGQLAAREAEISRLRGEQIALLRRLDVLQVDAAEGDRTMADWVSFRLDVSHQTASRLMRVARAGQGDIEEAMASGGYGLDRADLLCRLRSLGGPEEVIADSGSYSLGHLYGIVDRLRRVDAVSESFGFDDRYLVIQPSLDQSAFRIWGQLPGTDGQVVDKALTQREGELPSLPHQTQGQRRADAFASICMDSLTATSESGETGRAVTVAEVFVDATSAAPSRGETGVALSSGPRVGPNTLSEILCTGRVRVIMRGDDGSPIGVSHLGEAIPPAVRSHVLFRDQGLCTIDGCSSRYRLQPHHILQRSHGGDHDPNNLASLCWYHHHVAIHQMGMTLDPNSPPHRRRLQNQHNHGPPAS